jgi:hypothetical protein
MKALLGMRMTLPLAGVALIGVELGSQTVSARAVIAPTRNSVRLTGVTDRADGLWAGVALDVRIGRFAVSASGTRGQMTPAEAGAAPDQDVGDVSLGAEYVVRPWLGLGLRYTARAFSSAAGRQKWDMVGVGVTATHDLGTREVHAFANLAYLPLVTVTAADDPTLAFGSEVGISVAPNPIPLVLRLGYQIQLFRFPAGIDRSEQFEAFALSVGVRASRLGGRWRWGG